MEDDGLLNDMIYGEFSLEDENGNVEDEYLMNSHEIDANNVYMDEQRNHEEDTSIQLGSVKEEDSSFVVNQEAAKEKELEKERQKALNNESNKLRKLNNPANFETLDQTTPNSCEALIISNLAWWTTDAQVREMLLPFGNVIRLRFFEEKMNGKSKGECYVVFEHFKNAITAFNELSPNTIVDKKKLHFEIGTGHVFEKLKHVKRQQQQQHQQQQHNFNNPHNQSFQKQKFNTNQQQNQHQQNQHQQQQHQQQQHQQQQHQQQQHQQQQHQQQQHQQQQHQQPKPKPKLNFQPDQQFQGQDEPPMQQQRQQRFQYAPNDVRATRGGRPGAMNNRAFPPNRPPPLLSDFSMQQQPPEFVPQLPHINPNQLINRQVPPQAIFGTPFMGIPPMQPQPGLVPHINPAFFGGMNEERMRARDLDSREYHRPPNYNDFDRDRKYPPVKREPRDDDRSYRDDEREDSRERYERSREEKERDRMREEREREYRREDERRERKDDDRKERDRKDKYRDDDRSYRDDDRSYRDDDRSYRDDDRSYRDDDRSYRDDDRSYREKGRERSDKERDRSEKERKRSRSDYDYESSDRKNKSRRDDM